MSAIDVEALSGALRRDPDSGIWRAHRAGTGPIAYPADQNDACFRLEDGSFWFTHRNRRIIPARRRCPPDGFILDVGGGNGFVAEGLMGAGYETVLLEPGDAGARNAKASRRLPTVINATLGDAAIRPHTIPNVGLFDVLEHIEDDGAFVELLADITRPGGFLYLTVPSFNWLWSTADVDAMHYRRYTPRTITATLTRAFGVLYVTCLFQRLVPMSLLVRALPYRLGLSRPKPEHAYEREHAVGRKWLADLLARMLDHEVAAVAAGKTLAVGSSLLVVARRHG
jgi:SAM-dependent methyltransferase